MTAVALLKQYVDTGDNAAAIAIYERYLQQLLRLVGRRNDARASASSIVNSTLETVFRHTKAGEFHFDNDAALWCLLAKIAKRKLWNRLRKRRDVNNLDDLADTTILESDAPGPDEEAALRDFRERLWPRLTERERNYLEFRLEGYSRIEIADCLRVSSKTLQRDALAIQQKAMVLLQDNS